MAQVNGVVVVTDEVKAAGAITWWSLSGDLRLADLRAAWEKEGLDPETLPDSLSPASALREAVKQQGAARRLVRQTEDGTWCVVAEATEESNLDYSVDLRVRLDDVGRPVFQPPEHALAGEIKARYDSLAGETLTSGAASNWLSDLMRSMLAVSLRPNGGTYFVPGTQVDLLRKVERCLKASSAHSVWEVPALKSSEAVAAILDAVTREAEADAAKLDADVNGDVELGERALAAREAKAGKMLAKIRSYEVLLGAKLDGLREKVEALQASIAASALQAAAERAGGQVDLPFGG